MSKFVFLIALIVQLVNHANCDSTSLANDERDQPLSTASTDGDWNNPQGLTRNIVTGNRIRVAKSQIVLTDQDKDVFLRSIADSIVDRMDQDGDDEGSSGN